MKAALLVIDLQKAFVDDDNRRSMERACEYINAAIPLFRKRGLPVIWIQHRDDGDGAAPGLPGFEFLDALKPEPGDARLVKTYGNSFHGTGLAELLAKRGLDTVVVSGYRAENCVLSTVRGAQDIDIDPIVLKGSIASGVSERVRFVEDISPLMSFGALAKALD